MAVTGASGFVGRHVAAAAKSMGADVIAISRSGPGQRRAGLQNQSALRAAFAGCRSVIHCASSSSSDPEEQESVTVAGTAAVVSAARAAGVRRVTLLSTTAVYGYGPFFNAAAGSVPIAPASIRSAARARAESFVDGDHDVIVRPNLVYGRGDTSFVPVLLSAANTFPSPALTATVTIVHVVDLAAALVRVAVDNAAVPRELHVAHPRPVQLSLLVDALRSSADREQRASSVSLSAHQQSMLTTDATFLPTGKWGAAVGRSASEAFQLRREDLTWYRRVLASVA
ncbi:NAD-dependent epimerase/dehydratase family protein [Curtobacterium sp. PhB136]|uniref:NAD-dependent epimerase/dehydratase family protein n=1 Tax=Curtobacterium sp. PhB136 TaxID=2485181 RepID=UPI0014055AF0|nr:NAD-dependent epimerase/dehydratase family protein [Curtobacterium sp. PhB136]